MPLIILLYFFLILRIPFIGSGLFEAMQCPHLQDSICSWTFLPLKMRTMPYLEIVEMCWPSVTASHPKRT